MARVDTDILSVLEAVVAHLRTDLSMTEANCFWSLEYRDEDVPPTAPNQFMVLQPDGGTFDNSLFEGGGINQLMADTGLTVKLYTLFQLDRGGRDQQALFHTKGVLTMLDNVVRSLTGLDPNLPVGDTTYGLRKFVQPAGWSAPRRLENGRGVALDVAFNLSFDWYIGEA